MTSNLASITCTPKIQTDKMTKNYPFKIFYVQKGKQKVSIFLLVFIDESLKKDVAEEG